MSDFCRLAAAVRARRAEVQAGAPRGEVALRRRGLPHWRETSEALPAFRIDDRTDAVATIVESLGEQHVDAMDTGQPGVFRAEDADRGRLIERLWSVPVDGTATRRLAFDANRVVAYAPGKIRVSPDGIHVAYLGGQSTPEVWVLDNFLAALNPVRWRW